MAGHADVERQFAQRMAGVVLHALDIFVLAEGMAVVGEHRNDRGGQHERQHHGNHQFDEAQAALIGGQVLKCVTGHGVTALDR